MIVKIGLNIPDASRTTLEDIIIGNTPDCDKSADKRSDKRAWLVKFFNQWIKFGGHINIEFDTEKGTAKVLKAEQ